MATTPAKGAEFVALCNAVNGGPCDNTIQYKFTNSTIRKIAGLGTTTQQVRLDFGFTMGLLPNQSLNPVTLDPAVGRAHGFSSRGTEVPSGALTALGNTHSAAASFTYALSNSQCGTTSAASPEPFNIAGCTASRVIPCLSPATDPNKGVTCSSTGGAYSVNSSSLTSWNSITVAGNMSLQDNVQRTCGNLFTSGNPTCRAIERGTATLTYGLRRLNDKVNITSSSVATSGLNEDVLAVSAGENLQCNLHESGGGVSINPNDQGQFKISVFGDAFIPTSTMDATKTFLSLPGGTPIPALEIRYNQNFKDPETNVPDEFFDAWVVFDSAALAPAGITCAAFPGQTITLVLQSEADVLISGSTIVAGSEQGKKGVVNFGDFTNKPKFDTPVSCEIPAIVGPCNNP